jgi:hypothetical protein
MITMATVEDGRCGAMVPTRRSNRCEFCKQLRSARKQPDQNGVGLRNWVRDINGLAQTRYATVTPFPNGFVEQFQCVTKMLGNRAGDCKSPAALAPFYPLPPGLGKCAETTVSGNRACQPSQSRVSPGGMAAFVSAEWKRAERFACAVRGRRRRMRISFIFQVQGTGTQT